MVNSISFNSVSSRQTVYPSLGTTFGYTTWKNAHDSALRKGFNLNGTQTEALMHKFIVGSKVSYKNEETSKEATSLGFVILGNEGKETLYLGLKTQEGKIIDIPIATQRSDLKIDIQQTKGWQVTENGKSKQTVYNLKNAA